MPVILRSEDINVMRIVHCVFKNDIKLFGTCFRNFDFVVGKIVPVHRFTKGWKYFRVIKVTTNKIELWPCIFGKIGW